ncbi:alpha-amylase family glycosyl hydrolase [Eremococcus coleocola]|uniref:Glycosyl hydrolase family 13 catalytic domain-containing protein n=1 Tax=Eremococcus coleocola ACS-139-V-Col8 TaxID=908337 RepID=E4KPV0_9LACT|nr:alpha-amylase family glycosyl hydrolase [Eremococcus coleocola]EFR31150.1 hypothetical protein HMPREF9257_1589 [Eremococcus coleocola ACS-139-V-Col8]
MVTDPFKDGDSSNNSHQAENPQNPKGLSYGGDFKGVTENLDYLADLGVTTIWLTPIVQNINQSISSPAGDEFYAYHGYWASDFEKISPNLDTEAELKTLD